MIGVFFVVMLMLVLTLGLTGYSDRILTAVVGEQLRAERTSLAETIRDPDQLEKVLKDREKEFAAFYGLDRPWWVRLPGMVLRVMTLDLGEARNLRSFEGSNRVIDIVLERLPNTMLLLTTSLFITASIGLGLGAYMATQAGTWLDRFMSGFAAVSFAIPTWWIGILLILFLSVRWRILPSGGMYSTPPPGFGQTRASAGADAGLGEHWPLHLCCAYHHAQHRPGRPCHHCPRQRVARTAGAQSSHSARRRATDCHWVDLRAGWIAVRVDPRGDGL
jgi:peptide/nickel transport system permease protein